MSREREMVSYFEDLQPIEELKEMTFGEFMVEYSNLTRAQLFEALREQDKHPGVPLGEVVAALGYLPYAEIDRLLTRWSAIPVVEVVR